MHIGKCGGTAIERFLRSRQVNFARIHLTRPHLTYDEQTEPARRKKFIIWLRDPLERLQSAFEYQRALITTDVSHMPMPEGNGNVCEIGPRCLLPYRLTLKKKHGHAYPVAFETLTLRFDTANDLAEALSDTANATRHDWASRTPSPSRAERSPGHACVPVDKGFLAQVVSVGGWVGVGVVVVVGSCFSIVCSVHGAGETAPACACPSRTASTTRA